MKRPKYVWWCDRRNEAMHTMRCQVIFLGKCGLFDCPSNLFPKCTAKKYKLVEVRK